MTRKLSRKLFVGALLASAIASATTVHAATVTWTGGGADNNWSTALNWFAATPVANDDVVFSGQTRLSPVQNLGALAINSLSFDGSAAAFNVGGPGGLTIGGGGITNNSPLVNQTISTNLTLSASQSWTNNATTQTNYALYETAGAYTSQPALTISGAVNTGGNTLTIAGLGHTVVSGNITGAGVLSKTSAGALTLSGAANNIGAINISGGGVILVTDTGALGGSGAISITTNNPEFTFNDADGGTISRQISSSGRGVVIRNAGGAISFTGGFVGSSNYQYTFGGSGNISIDTNAINPLNSGNLDITKLDSNTLTVTTSGNIFRNLSIFGGAVEIQGSTTITGPVVVGATAASVSGTTPVSFVAGTPTLALSGNGAASLTSTLTLFSGSVLKLDNTAANLTDRLNNSAINLNGGRIEFIGNNGSVSSETLGNVTLGTAGNALNSVVSVNRNSATSATLTLGTVTRSSVGTGIDFQAGEALGGTSKILYSSGDNAFIGAWATVNNTATNATDFARYDSTGGTGVVAINRGAGEIDTFGVGLNTRTTTDTVLGGATSANSVKLGGNLDLGASTLTIASGGLMTNTGVSSISNGTIASGTTETIIYTPGGATATLSANVSNGPLTKNGLGTLILAGAQKTYTGQTNVGQGTLKLGASGVLPTASVIQVNTGATFDLNGFNATINDLIGSGTVNLSAGQSLTITNANVPTTGKANGFGGNLTGSGTLIIDGGVFDMGSNNSAFTGNITVKNGALQLLLNPGGYNVIGSGTLTLGDNTVANSNRVYLNGRTGNSGPTITDNATIIIAGPDVQVGPGLGNNGRGPDFAGAVSFNKGLNTSQTFRSGKQGAGVQFFGQVTLNNDVSFDRGNGSGGGSIDDTRTTFAKGITQSADRTLTILAGRTQVAFSGDGYNSGNKLILVGGADGANNRGFYIGSIVGANSTTFQAGDGVTQTFVRANGLSTHNTSVVLKSNATLEIGANAVVVNGQLKASALGLNKLIVDGGTLKSDNSFRAIYNNIDINGSMSIIDANGAGNSLLGTINVYNAPTITVNIGNSTTNTFAGQMNLNSNVIFDPINNSRFDATTGSINLIGSRTIGVTATRTQQIRAIGGNGSLTVDGPGTLELAGTASYTGSTTVNSGGTLRVVGSNRLNANSVHTVNGTLNVFGTSGMLEPNRESNTIAGLNGSGTITNTNGAGGGNEANSTLVINTTGSHSFSGTLNGNGRLAIIKQGTGSQEFTGTGINGMDFVTVEGGTLRVNNVSGSAFSNAPITVKAGATLAGDGSVGGSSVTTEAGAILAPGNSPGSLATGQLQLGGGTIYEWELGASDNDVINATHVFENGNGIVLKLIDAGGTPNPLTQYTVLTYSVRDDFTSSELLSTAKWTIDYGTTGWSGGVLTWLTTPGVDGGSLVISGLTAEAPIPEPTSLALLGLGAAGLLLRRRKA